MCVQVRLLVNLFVIYWYNKECMYVQVYVYHIILRISALFIVDKIIREYLRSCLFSIVQTERVNMATVFTEQTRALQGTSVRDLSVRQHNHHQQPGFAFVLLRRYEEASNLVSSTGENKSLRFNLVLMGGL